MNRTTIYARIFRARNQPVGQHADCKRAGQKRAIRWSDAATRPEIVSYVMWRRQPDSNRRSGCCRPVPYRLAMAPYAGRASAIPDAAPRLDCTMLLCPPDTPRVNRVDARIEPCTILQNHCSPSLQKLCRCQQTHPGERVICLTGASLEAPRHVRGVSRFE